MKQFRNGNFALTTIEEAEALRPIPNAGRGDRTPAILGLLNRLSDDGFATVAILQIAVKGAAPLICVVSEEDIPEGIPEDVEVAGSQQSLPMPPGNGAALTAEDEVKEALKAAEGAEPEGALEPTDIIDPDRDPEIV